MNITTSLLVIAAVLALQIYLSRRHSPWPGIFLAGVILAYTLFAVIFLTAPSLEPLASYTTGEILFFYSSILFQSNIPTMLLLCIHYFCRKSLRDRQGNEMER